jgi:hypothetical protein
MFSPTPYFFREKKRKKKLKSEILKEKRKNRRSGMPEILVYMHGYQDFSTVGNDFGLVGNCPPPGYATD